uniref:Uncharacterized protein n=1 Tax=Daucus carota subsp. sativus TaxID=79200 RepID=A0A164UCI1_DAUCS
MPGCCIGHRRPLARLRAAASLCRLSRHNSALHPSSSATEQPIATNSLPNSPTAINTQSPNPDSSLFR